MQYAPHFVSFFGWFENDESLFIAMEYMAAGDLEHFRKASPAFSELDASRIVWQLVEGVRHMHENGFAHRDLKPGNILIASTGPLWQVKIADFGISKQAFQGVTRQYTANMFGTMGYAAPEALGYYDDNDDTITYTMSVDIWAVGTIALTLLLGREVFPRQGDLSRYVNRQRPLDFSRQDGGELTEDCRDFITRMLASDPVVRPTAIAALAHPWLKQAATPPPEDTGMLDAPQTRAGGSSSAQDEPRVKQEPQPDDHTSVLYQQQHSQIEPATDPEIKQETKDDIKLRLYPKREPAALQRIHKFLSLDSALLTPKLRGLLSDKTRYFVLRSNNAIDIETSAAHGVWTSSERVNKILNKAYAASGGHVVMFFSVIQSRKFCGIARMTSPMDWVNTDPHWVEDVWQGRFMLDWLSYTELPFEGVKHVPVKETAPGFRAISCFDGQEISRGSAWELLRAYIRRDKMACISQRDGDDSRQGSDNAGLADPQIRTCWHYQSTYGTGRHHEYYLEESEEYFFVLVTPADPGSFVRVSSITSAARPIPSPPLSLVVSSPPPMSLEPEPLRPRADSLPAASLSSADTDHEEDGSNSDYEEDGAETNHEEHDADADDEDMENSVIASSAGVSSAPSPTPEPARVNGVGQPAETRSAAREPATAGPPPPAPATVPAGSFVLGRRLRTLDIFTVDRDRWYEGSTTGDVRAVSGILAGEEVLPEETRKRPRME